MSDAPTFIYERLQDRWIQFENDDERMALVDQVLSDIRAFMLEGYEGDGDGWAPRTFEETHRFANMVYALRDLRYQRGADGQGGLQIEMSPRAVGHRYSVFVHHEPDSSKSEVTSLQQREWISGIIRDASDLSAYSQSLMTRANTALKILNDREKAEIEFKRSWDEMIDFIKNEAKDSLEATHAFMKVAYKKNVSISDEYSISQLVDSRFGPDYADEKNEIIEELHEFDQNQRNGTEASVLAEQGLALRARIVDFQGRYGFFASQELRFGFTRRGGAYRIYKYETPGDNRGFEQPYMKGNR